MPSLETLLLFMVPVLTIALAPGPAMLYVITRTLAQGRVKGLVSVIGLETGAFIYVILTALGLSAVLLANPSLIVAIQIMGAFYLIYLGARDLWLSRAEPQPDVEVKISKKDSNKDVFIQGMITDLLNPKVALFFLAFLPPFVDMSHDIGIQFFILGAIFAITGGIINMILVFLTDWIGQKMLSKIKSDKANRYGSWLLGGVFITMGTVMLIIVLKNMI